MNKFVFLFCVLLLNQCLAQVPQSFNAIGKKYGVDPAMMYALSMTETGKRSNFGVITPWPWTANICDKNPGVRCKGYWFDSREELYQRLSEELSRGNDWFDVGLMQMNWHYHKNRFGSDLWIATHPLVNLNQAVGLLLEIQKRHRNPIDIYAAYHAGIGWKTKQYSQKRQQQISSYATKTARSYYRIINYGAKNEQKIASH